jgi:integration host factor subunit alpha
MKRSLIRADIAEAIYQKIGLSRNESADMVGTILDEISESLEKGNNVKITSFGSFTVRNKSQRIGRNPKTGARSSYYSAPCAYRFAHLIFCEKRLTPPANLSIRGIVMVEKNPEAFRNISEVSTIARYSNPCSAVLGNAF